MAESDATGGRTPRPGAPRGSGGTSAAASSRIRVDVTDVTKLKTALKDTQSEAKKLSDTLSRFDDRALKAVRAARVEIERLQRALGSGGTSSATGPKPVGSGDAGVGSSNQHAGQMSGQATIGAGRGGSSYLPTSTELPSNYSAVSDHTPGIPSNYSDLSGPAPFMSRMAAAGSSYLSRAGSYLTGPRMSSTALATATPRAQAAATPLAAVAAGVYGLGVKGVNLLAGHTGDAINRSYLINQFQLQQTGGSMAMSAQLGANTRFASMLGNTGLGYKDVSQAMGTLQATGATGGTAGASRYASVGFLSAVNPTQGNAASAQQLASTFTSQNYYALRLGGINAGIANGQNIQHVWDQIIDRYEGQVGRKLTPQEIQAGATQQGTGLNVTLTAMGITADQLPNFVRYWIMRNRTGQRGTAAVTGAVGRGGVYNRMQQMANAQGRATQAVDRGAMPGYEAGARARTAIYDKAGSVAGSEIGRIVTEAGGALSQFTGVVNAATKGLKLLTEYAIARTVLGAGGKGVVGRVAGRGVTAVASRMGIGETAAEMAGFGLTGPVAALGALALPVMLAPSQGPLHRKHGDILRTANNKPVVMGRYGMPDAYRENPDSYGISSAGGAATGTAHPGGSRQGASGGGAAGMSTVRQVIGNAEAMLGIPYRWGGESPRTGVDCSGLTQLAYSEAGIQIPRVAADQQKVGKPVPPDGVAPGDLLFLGNPAHHVMMSIGGGKVIEAPHTGDVVKILPFPASAADGGIRRIIGSAVPSGAIMGGSTAGGDSGDVNGTTTSTGGAVSSSLISSLFSISSGSALIAALSGASGGAANPLGGSTGPSSNRGGSGGVTIGSAPTSPAGAAAIGKRMAAQRGWGGRQWDALYQLWNNESHWNPNARNPQSGAAGIPQDISGNMHGGAAGQITWGMNYIAGRYHDPVHALQFWNRTDPRPFPGHWYEKGAWSVVRDEIAQLHKDEMVLPAGTAAKVRQLVETPQSATAQTTTRGMSGGVPVQLIFHVHQGSEAEARQHALRFARYVKEDHDITLEAAR